MREQACISRQARGGVWGVLTCLFARLPLFAVGPPFLKENNCFPLGNDATARIVSCRARGVFRVCLHAYSPACCEGSMN